ncbi:MAG: hypothetical protein RML36_08455 [Anaerolineae bacterium]|nr:hypothetical protein [Anaerolineae bacterium]MDW8099495.1 hypothetical protein [Anaerolineae bacterium]
MSIHLDLAFAYERLVRAQEAGQELAAARQELRWLSPRCPRTRRLVFNWQWSISWPAKLTRLRRPTLQQHNAMHRWQGNGCGWRRGFGNYEADQVPN